MRLDGQWEPMYIRRVAAVITSLSVLFGFAGLYAYLTFLFGVKTMAIFYFGPLFVFATLLVVTTFLVCGQQSVWWRHRLARWF